MKEASTATAEQAVEGEAPAYTDPQTQPLVLAKREPFDYAPRSFDQAMKLAEMLADSDLVPKTYQGKPANVFVAVQWGHELGLKPLQALQGIAVINGKPSLYGDAGKALLHAHGCQIDEADIAEIKATGIARCTIQRKGRTPVTRTFSFENAEKAGLRGKDGPWKTYPERQLAWRAFWFAARDAAADILKGMSGAEEMADAIDVTPRGPIEQPQSKSAKPNGQKPAAEDTSRDAELATKGQIAYLRKELSGDDGGPTEAEALKRFDLETLDGITLGAWKALKKWIADPTPKPEPAAEPAQAAA